MTFSGDYMYATNLFWVTHLHYEVNIKRAEPSWTWHSRSEIINEQILQSFM